MDLLKVAYDPVTADTILTNKPCLLFGLIVLASVAGGDVTIYDGQDAVAGRKVGRFEGPADESVPILFPHPIPLNNGLYVDVGSNITEVGIYWLPL